jgi:hypothetical protein
LPFRQTSKSGCQVIRLEPIILLLELLRSENEVIGNDWELIQNQDMRWARITNLANVEITRGILEWIELFDLALARLRDGFFGQRGAVSDLDLRASKIHFNGSLGLQQE